MNDQKPVVATIRYYDSAETLITARGISQQLTPEQLGRRAEYDIPPGCVRITTDHALNPEQYL